MRIIITVFIFVSVVCATVFGGEPGGEVLIGYFGPNLPGHADGGDMWCAANLAIDQANKAGGYKGAAFRLVQGWSENPWGSGVTEVVKMAYDHKVWVIIGGIDGASTHLAEQVVAKAHLTLLSPGSTDKTVNLANVPWMFSCLPSDKLQGKSLAEAVFRSVGRKRFSVISSTDHDWRLFSVELSKIFIEYKIAPSFHFEFDSKTDMEKLADKIIGSKSHAIIVIAGVDDSANVISAVRKKGFVGMVFGGPSMGRNRFVGKSKRITEGVVFPMLYHQSEKSGDFEKEFISRFGKRPDYLAAHSYDAVNLTISAIRKAGLDRIKIRDVMKELSGWSGVSGTFKWDRHGANERKVVLGIINEGRVSVFPRPCDLD